MPCVTSILFLIKHNRNFNLFHLGSIKISQTVTCYDDPHTKNYKVCDIAIENTALTYTKN